MNRGERQHQERTAYARKQARTPGYVAKHHGKTPGRVCSCEMCGNPRKLGYLTRQEETVLVDAIEDLGEPLFHPAEIRLANCRNACCAEREPAPDASVRTPPLRARLQEIVQIYE